jgi:hypothetical protein
VDVRVVTTVWSTPPPGARAPHRPGHGDVGMSLRVIARVPVSGNAPQYIASGAQPRASR